MRLRRGNLQPAHRGYWYQDIATAYVLVRSMVERYDMVIVDRKQVDDDRIDDLEVRSGGRRVRRQFKSSQNAARPLSKDDFVGGTSSLRIDRLVLTHVRAPADEYRLCATWAPPAANDPLTELLESFTASSTLATWPARSFRLRGELVWPEAGAPTLAPLLPYTHPGAEFGRAEVLAFCERFILELALPVASMELAAPGPLEQALVEELTDRIGIGRYPNHGRAPSDVAALAISLAYQARTQEASLTPAEVERALEIRVDFGRVSQAFPLDAALFHDRPTFRRTLHKAALAGGHQLVVAPPGAGKSWELTQLASELRAAGAIVARHYCYLEPGDDLIERRVTTDVFFGNLLGELLDADPTLHGATGARYAAGISELEATLEKAAASRRPVVIIVDGLDHIGRVRADARALAADDTDIVERLATVNVPTGVALVIGSQAGLHLDPLRARWGNKLDVRHVPPWTSSDLVALANLHGASRTLAQVGIDDDRDVDDILYALAQRAEGNPLYARYLARGLVSGLRTGTIAAPHEWIGEAPPIAGDVAVYYSYLYQSASAQAREIADVLGVIDFAVTEGELREMLPAFVASWVLPALAQLAPVLTVATGQGGVRIFHESFRRFMTQELARQGRSAADALAPVVAWLDRCGFYEDAKAYRFLLPALRRAGRGTDALAHIDVTFVSDSVAQAHPLDAVLRNLALAADIAAELRDWPALVRCVELHRAAHTCFDALQNNWHDYRATYLKLFGAKALAERLLFDGRPTLSKSDGLFACALVDDANGTAPWREYLQLYDAETHNNSGSVDPFDPEGVLTERESVILSLIHGRLRLDGRTGVAGSLLRHLRARGETFKLLFVRRFAARLARMTDTDLVERMAQCADSSEPEVRIARRAAAVLRLAIADEHARAGNRVAARDAAMLALADADTPPLAVACLTHGAWPSGPMDAVDLAAIPIAVGPDKALLDANGVRAWVTALRLCATDSARIETTLDAEGRRVEGPGWYRCWLRFVLALMRVDASRRAGRAGDVRGAFAELTRDVDPFRGEPRACDLFAIRQVIQETIAWGLTLLQTDVDWRHAITALTIASKETATRLDREDGGPFPTGTLIAVLLPHVTDPVGGLHVREAIERLMAHVEAVGTYYPTHAEYAMRLARARHAWGDVEGAREAWARGVVFFGAYGWRKDITVFDLIESAPALVALSHNAAFRALADVQPLVNAVVAHTDGRSTNHAPNAWLLAVLQVHPIAGMVVLARTLMACDDQGNWVNVKALHDVAEAARDGGDPALIDALLATLRFEVEHEQDSKETMDARVEPVLRLLSTDPPLATQALRRITAEVSGDGRRHTEGAAARLAAVAAEHSLAIPHIASPARPGISDEARPVRAPQQQTAPFRLPSMHVPPFAPRATLVDLLTGLRIAGATRGWDAVDGWDDVVIALSYHLGELVDAGREDDARRLVRFFARDIRVAHGPEHPLGKLAASLDAAGYARLAALAYALAYTATRGGGGWLHMGGKAHEHLIERAVAIDGRTARQVVADEIAYSLSGDWYKSGTSRHLVERLAAWGEPEAAEMAWRESLAVVRHRLPLAPDNGWFAWLRDIREPAWADEGWSIDATLVVLLLARVGDPRLAHKVNALAGVVRAIERRPSAAATAMRWWLMRDTHVTSALLALDALDSAEAAPYPITNALEDVLQEYAASDVWGARRLGAKLLERAGRSVRAERFANDADGNTNLQEVDPARQRALLSADISKVLDALAPYWPELQGRITRRLHALFMLPSHHERMGARYRIAHGRDGRAYPPTPTLFWEVELFEATLHKVLCGVGERLWVSGRWEPGLENDLLRRVLPNVRLHLGVAASRTARPAWPSTESATDGIGALPVLGDDDPTYAGWTRLALIERRYQTDPARPYRPPIETITLMSGAVAVPLGTDIPPDAFPFEEGRVDDWWQPESPSDGIPTILPLGSVIRLTRVDDWLGSVLVLIPPSVLCKYLGLTPATYRDPLVLCDSRRNPAIALRTWWVRNPQALSAESPECAGADLVIRADLLERLHLGYGVPLRELRVVWRHPVTRRSEEG